MKGVVGVRTCVLLVCLAICCAAVSRVSAGSGYTLKKGIVYLDGEKQQCELKAVAPGIADNIRYWGVFENEGEALVCFFPSNGACLTYLSIESAHACQDIFFSPDGKRFLLMEGSGIRPDVTYVLYEVAEVVTEKKAEISGIRENVQWIDPMRFVMTRIDDIREGWRVFNLAYGVRLSVVLHDAAAAETIVLKGSTGTQNYWFSKVVKDGKAVTVTEEFVKSEKDWGDEDEKKIERREIRVAIPAAG